MVETRFHRTGEGACIAHRYELPEAAVVENLCRRSGTVGSDHGAAAGKRLHQHVPEALEPRAKDEQGGPRHPGPGVGVKAGHVERLHDAEAVTEPLEATPLPAFTEDHQPRIPARPQEGERPDQGGEVLLPVQSSCREDERNIRITSPWMGRFLLRLSSNGADIDRIREHLYPLGRKMARIDEIARDCLRYRDDGVGLGIVCADELRIETAEAAPGMRHHGRQRIVLAHHHTQPGTRLPARREGDEVGLGSKCQQGSQRCRSENGRKGRKGAKQTGHRPQKKAKPIRPVQPGRLLGERTCCKCTGGEGKGADPDTGGKLPSHHPTDIGGENVHLMSRVQETAGETGGIALHPAPFEAAEENGDAAAHRNPFTESVDPRVILPMARRRLRASSMAVR